MQQGEKAINQKLKVREAVAVEIISRADNTVDFLSTINKKHVQSSRKWTRERHDQEWPRTHTQLPLALHGMESDVRCSQNIA